jgi:hypothetical protein
MASSGMLRRVALVRTHVSEELSASIIRVTRIGELGTTLAVTSNRRTQRDVKDSCCRDGKNYPNNFYIYGVNYNSLISTTSFTATSNSMRIFHNSSFLDKL